MKIKVGMLFSYDYKHLYTSLPYIYNDADEITLAIDKDRRTWSGTTYEIDDAIFKFIRELDTENKITVYEDDFYIKELSSIDNDTRQRNLMAKKMGKGGWHIQIDADEYFYDFPKFVKFLKSHGEYLNNPEKDPVIVSVFSITLFKKLDDGYLYINNGETNRLATNFPSYDAAKYSANHRAIFVNICIVHHSWARDEKALKIKIFNWGHKTDFDPAEFFKKWQNLDKNNYTEYKNFHPVYNNEWKKLEFGPGKDPVEFINNFSKKKFRISPFTILKKNLAQFYLRYRRENGKKRVIFGGY